MQMHRWKPILILAFSSLFFFAIEAQAVAPTISNVTPTTGAAVGASVVITGTNFGSSQGSSTVKFNGTTATTVGPWSATSITATVPTGATTGNIVVTVSNKASNGWSYTVLPTPTLTSLSVTSGAVGATVVLTGTNFGSSQLTGTVKFNGTMATVGTWTATSISVTVPSGAANGNVVVNASGVNTTGINFTVLPTPTLTSLSVTSGAVGATVVLTGTNFGSSPGTGTVKFSGTTAAVITWTATSITVTVPSGAANGNVVVNASGVNTTGINFTVLPTPTLTSLSVTSGAVGATVVLTGTNFGSSQGAGTVMFNGTTATANPWTATSITVTVPTGAASGNVVVNASGVNTSGINFTVLPTPTITSLSVTTGAVGAAVTITGTNLGATQGTGIVTFGGATATVGTWSATSITTTVPSGATTGNLVVNASGVATNGVSFTVVPAPSITSLSQTSGAVGVSVTITGANFGATQGSGSVSFNGTAATPTSWSATSITVPVPGGATTGNVTVSASGVTSSGVNFTVLPGITSLSPTAGAIGASITINGTNFGSTQGSSTLTFNGTATTPTSWGAFSIGVPVPSAATTGNVVVTVGALSSVGVNFTVVPAPTISSLSATSGTVGTSITITGTNFGSTQGTSTVTFNGTLATPASWNATSIAVPVPSGATTGNVLVNANGVASNGINFTVVETLSITNLSPTAGAVGSEVAITGTGFGATQGTSTISLSGTTVPVASWSDMSIIVNVPSGASSGSFLVTVNGQNVNSPTFIVTTLPGGWSDGDVGSVGIAGSASFANGTFTVQGAGQGIAVNTYTSDAFHFVYQPLSGDGTIVARVVSMPGTYTQAGVIIRETLDPASTLADTGGYGGGIRFFYRTTTGASSSNEYYGGGTPPYWVKLVRTGSTFNGYTSQNGLSWTQAGTTHTISMAQNVYIGLAVSSDSTTSLATATFDSVSVSSTAAPAPVITSLSATTGSIGSQVQINGTGFGPSESGSLVTLSGALVTINSWSSTSIIITIPVGATTGYLLVSVAPSMNDSNPVNFEVTSNPLPTSWLDQDIGPVGVAGSASFANGTFTVQGAGGGTWGTADSFHFVYQALSGDGTIIARVVSMQGSYTQAGVMIRETLDPASTYAGTSSYGGSVRLFYRTTTGGSSSNQYYGAGTAPYWVKLVRTGSTFSGYTSPDGLNWSQVGTSQTISMAQNAYIGLAVSSNSTSSLVTATFDNVASTVGTSPFVSGVSPNLGGIGTSVTIAGSNFGGSQGSSTISFGGAVASSVTSWSNTQIIASVPNAAPSGQGVVKVTVNSVSSPSNTGFFVIKPTINSLSPPAAELGGTITLNGIGFGSSRGNSTVQFNSVTAAPTSWSDTSITVIVPGSATSGPVTVSEDGVTSSGAQFTVIEAVSVTGVSPSVGPIGSTVTIIGAGFGSTQSNSTANLYGATATSIVSWSDTQIVAVVPAGAGTGPVNVQVAGIAAYGPWFTLNTTVQVTDSLGNFSDYTSEVIGGIWVSANSEGSGCSSCTQRGAISYTYDTKGKVLTKTDELGHITSYTYDSNGNVASVTVPITSSTSATTTYTYNGFGEVLTTTDPLGNVTTNTYDGNGNLLTVTTPAPNGSTAASVTTFTYDPKGQLLTIKDPLNNVTTLTYYPTGLINTITDAQQNPTTYTYDPHGNRKTVTDAMSNQTTFDYDTGDRLKTITYPGSTGTTVFGYDYRGRRISVTDQNTKTTNYTYDDANRLITVTDASIPANVTTYGYDTENNLTSIQDANNHSTSFNYDAFGRVTKTAFPSGYVETYGYDAVGNLQTKLDRKNQLITYTYDQLSRLTQKLYPDSTTVNYTYDNDSRLTQVSDPTGTYQFTFDNMGRLTGTTTSYAFLTGRNFTTSFAYDAASNRTGFTDPESGATSYVYDTLNRLQTLTPPAAFTATGNFGFTYDTLSRRTQMTRPNGLKSIYAYDNLSHLLSVLHQSGSTTLDGAAYGVDNAGNRTSRTPQPSGTTTNFGYDNIYQLLSATQGGTTTESYTYDSVGNRLSSLGVSPYNNNSSNELTSIPGTTYTYDSNGNTQTSVTGSNTTTYAWDFENRLTSVTLPGTGGTVTFKYDPFGRRIYKSSSSGTSVFAYDGDNLVEETNASGTAVARYSQGPKLDEPLAMLRSGATSFYHSDGLGSVTSLSNTAGALAQAYTLDSFGNQTASSGSLTNSFRYTGREFDQETNLYFYRTRYYDQAAGRFISEDPIGFKGGINFYAYVTNRPVDLTDPTGLKGCVDCTKADPLPSNSPKCDEYGTETYAGASEKCFCKCAGDSAWAQKARGCLVCAFENGLAKTARHKLCYDAAGWSNAPWLTLINCERKCVFGH